jgi:hypothetical protein
MDDDWEVNPDVFKEKLFPVPFIHGYWNCYEMNPDFPAEESRV